MKCDADLSHGRAKWRERRLILVTLLLGTAATLTACTSHVTESLRSCPCNDGYVCCDSGICAKDQSSCDAATLALSQMSQGQWDGYIENFEWSTDDSLHVSIDVTSDGTLTGTVRFGKVVLSALPTGPGQPWPASVVLPGPAQPYLAGFPYSAFNIHWETRRLRFVVSQWEPSDLWCFSHTPQPDIDGGYTCESDEEGAPECSTACQCGFFNCRTHFPDGPTDYTFDIALDNDTGNGSVNLGLDAPELHNVRLRRTGHVSTSSGGTGGDDASSGSGGVSGTSMGGNGGISVISIAGGGGSGGTSAGGSTGCLSRVPFENGTEGLVLGPNNHVFGSNVLPLPNAMNYAGQVVFPGVSLMVSANFMSTPAIHATLGPTSGLALTPWLGELSVLPTGCDPKKLVGRTVKVSVLWRLLGAIGTVPPHGLFLGTSHAGVPAAFSDATVTLGTSPSSGGSAVDVRTLNTLDAVELTHTFSADEDVSEGVFLRAYALPTDGLPTNFYLGGISFSPGDDLGVGGAGVP